MMEWQPIETAPYEITVVIYSEDYNPELHLAWWCFNEDGEKEWHMDSDAVEDDIIRDIEPTHWLPIPKLPK